LQIDHDLVHRGAVIGVESRHFPQDGVATLAAWVPEDLAAFHHLTGDPSEPLCGMDAHIAVVHPLGLPPLFEPLASEPDAARMVISDAYRTITKSA
jgi:hypothetical protein